MANQYELDLNLITNKTNKLIIKFNINFILQASLNNQAADAEQSLTCPICNAIMANQYKLEKHLDLHASTGGPTKVRPTEIEKIISFCIKSSLLDTIYPQ